MNVCKNCGFEFDGDFCPECGTKYEASPFSDTDSSEVTLSASQICETEFLISEYTCTNCGTTFQGSCCPRCGLRISDSTGENVEKISSAVEKKYWVLTRLPLILFFSLVFLLLIAYFCKYTSYEDWTFNIFYDWDDVSAYLIWFFPVYTDAAVVLFIVGMVNGTRKYKYFNLFQIFGIVGIIFMSVSVVNGCVAITATVVDPRNWSIGPASIMITGFSLACLIPSIVCVVRSKLLVSSRDDYALAESRDRQRKLEKKTPEYRASDKYLNMGRKTYLGISRTVSSLFFIYAVLLVIACTVLRRSILDDYFLECLDEDYVIFLETNTILLYSDVWLSVFCFIDMAVAVIFSVWGLVNGGKKIGKLSLYQIVGIIGIICMAIALISGSVLCDTMRWQELVIRGYPTEHAESCYYFHAGAGPICVVVFSGFFIILVLVFLILSAVFTKSNTAYAFALEHEREQILKRKE